MSLRSCGLHPVHHAASTNSSLIFLPTTFAARVMVARCTAALSGVEQAVELRAARVHALGRRLLGNLLDPHDFGKLPGDDALERDCLDLLQNAVVLEQAVER